MADASRTRRTGQAGDGPWLYAIALGSNRPLGGGRGPAVILRDAMAALDAPPLHCLVRAPVISSAPIGPSLRRYANGATIVATALSPPALLAHLQGIERRFGRKRQRRWGARTLDLDIVLWSGGRWAGTGLSIPHAAFRDRGFVLVPLRAIAGDWRDPVTGTRVRHLAARLGRAKPVDPTPHGR